jgi:hypothetical protein
VFAFEQRVNDDGVRTGGPGVDLTMYDVTITSDPPFFNAVLVGTGFSDQVTVQIARNLSKGSAAASDVPLELCDFPDPSGPPVCAPAGSVSVDVQWQGFGATSKFRFHDMFSDPFSFDNSRTSGTFRSADASGSLDGTPVEDTDLFPSSLQTDKLGSVDRFAPLATSTTTAVAAATAASVAHTRESSAFGVLSNCPSSPSVGTTCDGVVVDAFALSGRADHQPLEARSVFADVYELTFTPAGIDATFVASGFDGAAIVNVDTRLAGATTQAHLDVVTCDPSGCTSGPPGALSVAWTEQGPTQPLPLTVRRRRLPRQHSRHRTSPRRRRSRSGRWVAVHELPRLARTHPDRSDQEQREVGRGALDGASYGPAGRSGRGEGSTRAQGLDLVLTRGGQSA